MSCKGATRRLIATDLVAVSQSKADSPRYLRYQTIKLTVEWKINVMVATRFSKTNAPFFLKILLHAIGICVRRLLLYSLFRSYKADLMAKYIALAHIFI